MPEPNLGTPPMRVGGYIPGVDIPCERFIGESIGWVIFIGVSYPVLCRYIPWLCCPLPFQFNNTYAISSDIACEEIGAQYGAVLFWGMQGISIWGLVLSLTNILRCFAGIGLGTQEAPEALQNILDKLRDPEQQPANITLDEIKDIFRSPNKPEDTKPNITTIIRNLNPAQIKKNYNKFLPTVFGGGPQEDDGRSLSLYSLYDDNNITTARARRLKRQSGFLGLSIPTLEPLYTGPDERDDICERDEILHVDGDCYHILSQGPCEDTEFVLMDPETRKGYCAPRLCNPDRVFVFGDQSCHDPFENDICPPGRILFTSSFGSPVCGCPYGTYEEEPDLDEDVCQPVLGQLESCDPGQVYWFRSFRAEPECLPDPCKGLNAKKGLNELPYVPSIFDGKCYQLGQELIQCPDDTFYTLSYSSLHGICAALEDAGYTVLDDEMLEAFARMYGSRLPRDISSPSSFSSSFSSHSSSSSKNRDFPNIGSSAISPDLDSKSNRIQLKIGQSVLSDGSSSDDDSSSSSSSRSSINKNDGHRSAHVLPTHASAFSPPAISFGFNNPVVKLFQQANMFHRKNESVEESDENEIRSRKRRSELPHASPETVFQSSLAACRAGGKIGLNFKCNIKYLPNRLPLSRPKREIAPIEPFPACPKGSLYSIRRTCVSRNDKVVSSLIAHGLG